MSDKGLDEFLKRVSYPPELMDAAHAWYDLCKDNMEIIERMSVIFKLGAIAAQEAKEKKMSNPIFGCGPNDKEPMDWVMKKDNDIVTTINKYVPLGIRGFKYIGFCPFHAEKTASFTVDPKEQRYKCLGCGAGGNEEDFIRAYRYHHLTSG